MAYLRFLNSEKIHKAIIIPSKNIVTLKFEGEKEISTAGFDIFNDKECTVDLGGSFYHQFKTIYRNDDITEKYNGYQLSNNGSIYTEQDPEIAEPTLKELQELKVSEMNSMQQKIVSQGCEVELSDGTKEKFTLTTNDQLSLNALSIKNLDGLSFLPWHPADESVHCKFYSEEDMKKITDTCMNFVTYHVTYFRDLRIYIRSLSDKEQVKAINYGDPIPAEYQSEVLQTLLYKADGVVE